MTLLRQPAGDTPPLRCCLLSGGASRRMGQDKALLPHPEGGTWLERSLTLLAQLERPITLLSRHPGHLELAQNLNLGATATGSGRPGPISAIAEPAPWEGPLLALHRLMLLHPDQRLLLCPVDMPELSLAVLGQLVAAAAQEPEGLHLAHDGLRLQPLLGVYPSSIALRQDLTNRLDAGERRLQSWLGAHPFHPVPLDPRALRNVNRPADIRPDFNGPDGDRPNSNGPNRDQPNP